MTPPNPLIELAERVQALTCACRETDLAIMQAVSGHPWRWADSRTFEPQTVITWDEYGEGAPGNPFFTLEEFTASLDAAITLVPEGWWLTLDRYIISDKPEPNIMTWRVWLKRLTGDVDGDGPCYHQKLFSPGATPATALTAAVLRARAASENSHD